MIVAVIDNGSLEPAAHRNLRSFAAALSERTQVNVRAVSWKHSDRIPDDELDQTPAWTLEPFVRSLVALGQREFVFVPFFISAEGAIVSALRRDLEKLQAELGGFTFTFTDGLAGQGVIPAIVADRIRTCRARHALNAPAIVVVDHGGPSETSARLRDELAAEIERALGRDAGLVAAASMEGRHPPLLDEQLRNEAFAGRETIVAPLFLSPGRHAGPDGDITQICRSVHPKSHVTDLVGTHPLAVNALAGALRTTLSAVHAESYA